jgi:uncharacterized membrane protein YhaH (DUF805 family)
MVGSVVSSLYPLLTSSPVVLAIVKRQRSILPSAFVNFSISLQFYQFLFTYFASLMCKTYAFILLYIEPLFFM